jgi:hypothetical protein
LAQVTYLEAIRRAAMLLALIFSAAWSGAQVSAALPRELDGYVEVARLDLTDVEPRGFLREPRYPDDYAVRNISGTTGAGSKCDEKEVPLDGLSTLTAAVVSVEGTVFASGDEVIFSVVIANPCARPLLLPWSPHPRDIEDDGGRYTFRMMGIRFRRRDKEPHLYSRRRADIVRDSLSSRHPKGTWPEGVRCDQAEGDRAIPDPHNKYGERRHGVTRRRCEHSAAIGDAGFTVRAH